ncbi:MAG: hypothetical protein GXP45_05255 [bacterium]|nr:hypothetical protein [bacterium]
MGIRSHAKETLFGFLLYFYYLNTDSFAPKNKKPSQVKLLLLIYVREILQIDQIYEDRFVLFLLDLLDEFAPILQEWVSLDDNKSFMQIARENWESFVENKTRVQILAQIGGEDMVWFRGFLKNITYYNKRFLIPK